MQQLSTTLARLIALSALSAAGEMLTGEGHLRESVRLISGILTAGMILELIYALMAAFAG